MLQESCEFFLKHNSKVRHKKKHGKPGSHKLKVISKSMGTSTGVTTDHGTSAVAIADHDYLGQETSAEVQTSPEASLKEGRADRANTPRAKGPDCGEPASTAASNSKFSGDQIDRKSRAGSVKEKSSVSEGAPSEGRVSPKGVPGTGLMECSTLQIPSSPEPNSLKGSTSLLVRSASGTRKEQGAGGHSDT